MKLTLLLTHEPQNMLFLLPSLSSTELLKLCTASQREAQQSWVLFDLPDSVTKARKCMPSSGAAPTKNLGFRGVSRENPPQHLVNGGLLHLQGHTVKKKSEERKKTLSYMITKLLGFI